MKKLLAVVYLFTALSIGGCAGQSEGDNNVTVNTGNESKLELTLKVRVEFPDCSEAFSHSYSGMKFLEGNSDRDIWQDPVRVHGSEYTTLRMRPHDYGLWLFSTNLFDDRAEPDWDRYIFGNDSGMQECAEEAKFFLVDDDTGAETDVSDLVGFIQNMEGTGGDVGFYIDIKKNGTFDVLKYISDPAPMVLVGYKADFFDENFVGYQFTLFDKDENPIDYQQSDTTDLASVFSLDYSDVEGHEPVHIASSGRYLYMVNGEYVPENGASDWMAGDTGGKKEVLETTNQYLVVNGISAELDNQHFVYKRLVITRDDGTTYEVIGYATWVVLRNGVLDHQETPDEDSPPMTPIFYRMSFGGYPADSAIVILQDEDGNDIDSKNMPASGLTDVYSGDYTGTPGYYQRYIGAGWYILSWNVGIGGSTWLGNSSGFDVDWQNALGVQIELVDGFVADNSLVGCVWNNDGVCNPGVMIYIDEHGAVMDQKSP